MKAGRLRYKVTIEALTETTLPSGETAETPVVFAEVFADVRSSTVQEIMLGERQESKITHKVYIRHLAGLETGMRVVWDGRYLNIENIVEDRTHARWMTLLCVERG